MRHTIIKQFLLFFGVFAWVFLSAAGALAAPNRVNDFALLDSQGQFHQLSRYLNDKALVLMSWSGDCHTMNNTIAALNKIRNDWQKQGFAFALLDTSRQDRAVLKKIDTGFPLLDDEAQLVTGSLGFTHVGEVFVLNPQRLSLYYRGPVADVADIFPLIVDNNVNETVVKPLSHCAIDYSTSRTALNIPDYTTDVAPIIVDKCAGCHRNGGVGPFAMDSHIMLMGWSPMIREVLLNKRMPPIQIDPLVGHSQDATYINAQELETIIAWIDAGSPRGGGAEDPLATLQYPSQQWKLGEPDLIIKGPRNEVARTGVMDYLYSTVVVEASVADEPRWVKAIQIRPGDESVLHHLVMNVTAPGEDFFGPEKTNEKTIRRFLGSYAPGAGSVREYPANTGVLIPPGHRLSMQFHYVTNGRATIDETEVGLYFYDQPPAHEYKTLALSPRFVLPPNASEYRLLAEHVFERDVVITGIRAHMHFRGKHMKFSVQQNDGSWQDVLSIPAYNYGWQPQYRLQQSVSVAAGKRVRVSGAFDNSVSNPNNPDPDKEVPFGVDSWNEMFSGYFSFHYAGD